MKSNNLLSAIILAIFALGFVACDGDDDVTYFNVEFENIQLGEQGYINNVQYVEEGITFNNYFDSTYFSWKGFAISKNVDMETPGFSNQYSVYGTSGANGSSNFAVGFYSEFDDYRPSLSFVAGVEHKIVSAYFSLTTFGLLAIRDGNDGYGAVTAFSLDENDLYSVIATGYNAADTKTKEVEIKLADYTGASAVLFDQWIKVDLSELGEVNKVTFKVTSTDVGTWGINTPTYFAIDNICFED